MKRKLRKNFQQLILQNRLEIKANHSEMERIEKKIEDKHLKENVTISTN